MIKRLSFGLISAIVAIMVSAQELKINHGPYLQCPSTDGMSVYFTTDELSFSWVEVRGGQWDSPKAFYEMRDGMRNAYANRFSIELSGLEPATAYQYRIVSVKMNEFQPYKIKMGERIMSDWYSFKTVDPKRESFSFMIYNDVHENSGRLACEYMLFPVESADFVVFNGDMIDNYSTLDQPYKGFIDISVERFARTTPFIYTRGNHETRGKLARQYHEIVGTPNGRFYNIYYYGNTALLVLDTGEDKPDDTKVYAGINDFDGYRTQQTEWLKKVLSTKEFRKAKHKIVLMHMPPFECPNTPDNENHGCRQIQKEWLPLFNKAGIDLMFCGHTHEYIFQTQGTKGNNFPIVVSDNHSAIRVDVSDDAIRVQVKNEDGKLLLDSGF